MESNRKYREGVFKLLKSPGINSKESIPPSYIAWQAGTTTRFLAPMDCTKIPSLSMNMKAKTKLFIYL